jgi:purine catabolism regulator
MSLTVRELTEVPFLRTRLFAGASGAENRIAWAHSVEMPHPWEWLETGDLLMTVGLGVPKEPDAQVRFVESLAGVGISGIALGEGMLAPPLSDEMVAAADRLALPLLWTALEVPFIQIARTVAAASRGPEHLRLVKTVRIYDSLRAAAIRSSSPAELLEALGREIDCDLSVCTNDAGRSVFPDARVLAPDVVEAFLAVTAARSNGMPGILRVPVKERTALVVPVPAQRPVSLLALPRGSEFPPYAILQHVATVAALEVERLLARREESRRFGSETLAHLLEGRLSAVSAAPHLEAHGLGAGPYVMVISHRLDDPSGWAHHPLAERGVPNMLRRSGDLLYCLIPAGDDTVAEVLDVFDVESASVGVSDPFSLLETLPNAVHEARWALDTARAEGRPSARYGERLLVGGPRWVGEARDLIDRVLGPVIEYDRERSTDLVNSLTVFLRCNRSWQQAAAELFVHKQTLVYRMRRVEELTGRKLGDTEAIAELWPAIRALEILR